MSEGGRKLSSASPTLLRPLEQAQFLQITLLCFWSLFNQYFLSQPAFFVVLLSLDFIRYLKLFSFDTPSVCLCALKLTPW